MIWKTSSIFSIHWRFYGEIPACTMVQWSSDHTSDPKLNIWIAVEALSIFSSFIQKLFTFDDWCSPFMLKANLEINS